MLSVRLRLTFYYRTLLKIHEDRASIDMKLAQQVTCDRNYIACSQRPKLTAWIQIEADSTLEFHSLQLFVGSSSNRLHYLGRNFRNKFGIMCLKEICLKKGTWKFSGFFYGQLTTVQFPGFGDCGVKRLDAVEIDKAVDCTCFLFVYQYNRLDFVAKQLRNRVLGCLVGQVSDIHGL